MANAASKRLFGLSEGKNIEKKIFSLRRSKHDLDQDQCLIDTTNSKTTAEDLEDWTESRLSPM